MGINKVILVGRAGKDAELKALSTGTNIAKFSLATDDRQFKDADGKPRTEWHQIVAWGKLAEICGKYVTKGKQLYLEGSIRTRSWEHEGVKRYSTEVHIQQMEMLGGGQDSGQPREQRDDHSQGGGYGGGQASLPDDDDVPFSPPRI